MWRIIFTLVIVSHFYLTTSTLEEVQDDDLLNLIKSEKCIIVLFSRKYCEICDSYENELTSLREDLVDILNAWVVKVSNSQLTRLYSPSGEPAVVFFRHGVPLLYEGPLNDELILHTFTTNKEPLQRELTDETFEHLTQAASGATTGDWFVMFYTSDCVDCQRLQAVWEAVAVQLKSRMNVARVNRVTTGAGVARRFSIFHVPTFILFRQGRMCQYPSQNYGVTQFVEFARKGCEDIKSEKVPLPKSSFDDLVALIFDYFHQFSSWSRLLLLLIFLSGFGLSIYILIPSLFKRHSKMLKKMEEKRENKDE